MPRGAKPGERRALKAPGLKRQTVTIRLREDVLAALKARAEAEALSLGKVAEEAISEYLSFWTKENVTAIISNNEDWRAN